MTKMELVEELENLEEQIEENKVKVCNMQQTIMFLKETNMEVVGGTKEYIEEILEELKVTKNILIPRIEEEHQKVTKKLIKQLEEYQYTFEE